MIAFIVFLGLLVLVGWLMSSAIVKIPSYHYGILERFGKRTGRILTEGYGYKIPFIDEVELVSLELGELDVAVKFTTKDKLQLEARGSLQYRPDPRIIDDDGRNVFITISEEVTKSGIEDAIQSILGGLGGLYKSGNFIGNRQALADLLNGILRLGRPPHLQHNAQKCTIANCGFGTMIDAEKLIDFYKSHWRLVRGIISKERHKTKDFSPTEKRYGLDVEAFFLSQVDFSEETKKAFEKEQQAKARQKAFRFKLEMAKKAKDLGASAQVALNAADVSLDSEIKKNVISVEGDVGVLGGIIGSLTKGGQK